MPKYEVKVEATTQRDIIVDAVSEYEAWIKAQIEMVGLVGGENTKVISSRRLTMYDKLIKPSKLLASLRLHAVGNVNLHKTNIAVYLNNPAGIGEHSDIMEAVQSELDKMALHQDRIDLIDSIRSENEESDDD